MRLKPDGSLDLDWWEPAVQTPDQIYQDILDNVLRNNPSLTREEAQAILAHHI
jgi:hypothetical protein